MIDYLYSSKSLGVSNYTKELKQHMTAQGAHINLYGLGGKHVMGHMNEQQLRDHLIQSVPHRESTVLHIQHDSLMFRGGGDEVDEMDNMCWFLDQMLIRYEQVFITLHSRTKFPETSWLKKTLDRFMNNIFRVNGC